MQRIRFGLRSVFLCGKPFNFRIMLTLPLCCRSGKQYSTLRAVAVPAEAADVAASEAEGPTALYQSSGVRTNACVGMDVVCLRTVLSPLA